MAYSIVGIVNLALGRIGVKRISSWPDPHTTQGIVAGDIWEYIRDEVLEAKDWRFAKTRYALSQSTISPVYTWDYAYYLPADFLKLCRGTDDDPSVYPHTYSGTIYPWVIEALPDGTKALLTNYDNSDYDLYINYIRREVNPARYTAHFISALAFRLGAELAIQLPESTRKFEGMMELYRFAIKSAEDLNASLDFLEDERGNTDWVDAGR